MFSENEKQFMDDKKFFILLSALGVMAVLLVVGMLLVVLIDSRGGPIEKQGTRSGGTGQPLISKSLLE